MSRPDRKPFWRFDRDVMNRVSNERIGRGQPEADAASPVRWMAGRRPLNGAALDPDGSAGAGRLRAAIDEGRTGDKIGHPDPAAAPLGTDEEAAGTPLRAAEVDAAIEAEVVSRAPRLAPAVPARGPGGFTLWALVATAAVGLFVAVFAMAGG